MLSTRQIDLITLHCSASASGKPLQQGTPGRAGFLNAPQVINAWHAARGFKRDPAACRAYNPTLPSIGYHFVIDLTGEVWTGRAQNEVGAHVAGFNARSVGICLVGGAEPVGRYTAGQWSSLTKVVQMVARERRVPLVPAGRYGTGYRPGVCGHRDLSPDTNGNGIADKPEWLKTCPGFEVRAWLANGMYPLPQHIHTEAAA